MGFDDFMRKAAQVGGSALDYMEEKMEEKAEQMEQYKRRYEGMSTEELVRYYKKRSGLEKAAIRSLLVERGYGSGD